MIILKELDNINSKKMEEKHKEQKLKFKIYGTLNSQ